MAYIEYPKGFKGLAKEILRIKEEIGLIAAAEAKERLLWEINRSFERQTISVEEYEILLGIADIL